MYLQLIMRAVLGAWLASCIAGQCSFPDALLGNWTSSNYGILTFSDTSPQFVMSFGAAPGTSSTSFDCFLVSGSQFVLKSLSTITVFEGTAPVYAYLCLDLREGGPYSYYYYQNSAEEVGFSGERMVGISQAITDVKVYNVCTTTLDTAEFHIMVKIGFESEAVIQCANDLLLAGSYIYTDSTGTYCSDLNSTIVDSCSNNLTTIQFNNSLVIDNDCAALNPGWSASGFLGCVANVYDRNRTQYYVSLLNFDETVDDSLTYRYTCVAVMSDANGTVFVSLSPAECVSGQTATDLPSGGALLEITPSRVPIHTDPTKDWTWLIILGICLFVLVLVLILTLLICRYLVERKKKIAREKSMLPDKHPLAEISLRLDAPATLGKLPNAPELDEKEELYSTPRGEKPMKDPMPEPSLLLDFKPSKWSKVKEHISAIVEDPYGEISKDEVVQIKPSRNKKSKGFWNIGRRTTVLLPKSSKNLKSLPNGGLPNRNKVANGTFVINKPKAQKPKNLQSEKPKVEKVQNLHAENLNVTHTEDYTQTMKATDKRLPKCQATQILIKNEQTENTESKEENIPIAYSHEKPKLENLASVGTVDDQVPSISGSLTKVQTTADKVTSVHDSFTRGKTTVDRSASIHKNRGIRTNNRRSLITWTGKRLVRSQSNVSDSATRRTSTRLSTISKWKSTLNKGPLQRPTGKFKDSVTLQGNADRVMTTNKELVTTETNEPHAGIVEFATLETEAIDNKELIQGNSNNDLKTTKNQDFSKGTPIQPQFANIMSATSPDLEETNSFDDYVQSKVNDWLQTNEKQTDTRDLNASFNGTYASFLNIKSKTDLHKMLRPTASRMPWR